MALLLFDNNSKLCQHRSDAVEGSDQRIDIVVRSVAGKAGAYRAWNAIAVHDGLSAVVTRTDGHAQFVKQGPHIVGVGFAYQERDDSCLVGRCAEETHAGNRHQPFSGIMQQLVLMVGDMLILILGDSDD